MQLLYLVAVVGLTSFAQVSVAGEDSQDYTLLLQYSDIHAAGTAKIARGIEHGMEDVVGGKPPSM